MRNVTKMAIRNQETPVHAIDVNATDPNVWQSLGLPSAELAKGPIRTVNQIDMPSRREKLLPPVLSPRVLGQAAVASHVDLTGQILAENRPREDTERMMLQRSLVETREYLARLTPKLDRKIITRLFEEFEMSSFIQEITGGQDIKPFDRLALLSAKDNAGNPIIADESLLSFVEWRLAQVAKKQAEFEKSIAPMRHRYIQRLEDAIKKGWIAGDVLNEQRRDRILNTSVLLDDGLGRDMQFDHYFGGSTAYALPATENPCIVMRADANQDKIKATEATFTHEMTHILTGRTHDNSWYMNLGDVAPDYGVERLFKKPSLMASSLNEATTEHFALALLGGDIDHVKVFRSQNYQAERYVLKSVCAMAGISPRLFVQAMFEDDIRVAQQTWSSPWEPVRSIQPKEDNRSAIYQLRTALTNAFPNQDVLELLSEMELIPTLSSFNLPQAHKEMRKLKKSAGRTGG